MKKAIVIGSTGLVGSNLIQLLLKDNDYNSVVSFSRKSLGISHPKLIEHIIDFEKPFDWKSKVMGDVLFSALGTTLKQAGSKDAQYKVDFTFQYEFALTAANNKVPNYVLVSAAFAKVNSSIFYSRIKGELERDVEKLSFAKTIFIRPGLINGNRKDKRIMEKISATVLSFFSKIPGLKKWKPIAGAEVAQAMINAEKTAKSGKQSYTLQQVFDLLKI